MARTKIAITLDSGILGRLDELVGASIFPNRSRAIEAAVEEKLARIGRTRLASECAKLDPVLERALAEEGATPEEDGWPGYRGARSGGPI